MEQFHPIDQLSQIKKVEAPNALFGKIQARLENLKSENFSTGISISIAASIILFLSLNIRLIVLKENTTNKMNLFTQVNTNNDLYK